MRDAGTRADGRAGAAVFESVEEYANCSRTLHLSSSNSIIDLYSGGARRFRDSFFENVFMARLLTRHSAIEPLVEPALTNMAPHARPSIRTGQRASRSPRKDTDTLFIVDPTTHGMTCPLIRAAGFEERNREKSYVRQ